MVLERIRAVTAYIRQDVNGFQEEWLRCRREDQEKAIRDDKRQLAKAQKRLADLDVLLTKIYEDMVLEDLSRECYQKMAENYEAEQERLKLEIAVTEEWVEQREEMDNNLDRFFSLVEKYVDIPEPTTTIVNEFIKKIIVYAPDKSSGKRTQEIRIIISFLDEVELPEVNGPVAVEQTQKRRKTA